MRYARARAKKSQPADHTVQNSAAAAGHRLQTGTHGNQTSMRLVRETLVQRKLRVSEPGDRYEQEADRVADSVMRIAEPSTATPSIQRMCTACNEQKDVPKVQRACKECEEEAAAIDDSEDERILVSAKPMGAAVSSSTFIESSAMNSLAGGHPLPRSTRSFFESRMGHSFDQVRVHDDAQADNLARSVSARAFTRANHLVFRFGEYQPDTATGRHLLAHELTHTIQQGGASSAAAAIQRVCEVTPPPSDMVCPPATGSTGPGTPILFGQDSPAIPATDLPTLSAIAAAWHNGGGVDVLRIDGFASCDGAASHNWRLSCSRAQAVATELETPTDGSPGVDPGFLNVVANGETNSFSPTTFPPNRRVEITTGGTPPVGPTCPLTITGPDNVDHYCAAYVTPNDVASCGTFPAPNIVLTAGGAAPGATLTWRISRGTGRASIVGAIVGTTVTIRGDAASVTQGDVTVQVSNGTCTARHFLTVRQPSALAAAPVNVDTPTVRGTDVTYTVQDQFGNPMNAGICIDETITVCRVTHPRGIRFGDAPTDASGQARDHLRLGPLAGVPAGFCRILNQSLTAGGCGPLLNNTIVFQASGITLNIGASCVVGDPCP